jgi:transcriptional regulator with XRE-family HTH domain
MNEAQFYRQFGGQLRERRRRLGLTQESLAEDVGLSRTSITNIERGEQRILLHQLYSFADKLKVRPEKLLPDLNFRAPEIEQQLRKLSLQQRELILKIVRTRESKKK